MPGDLLNRQVRHAQKMFGMGNANFFQHMFG